MILLETPQLWPVLAALVLTLAGAVLKRAVLSYAGGLCWAAASVLGLVQGASLTEILIFTLVLLLLGSIRTKEADDAL